MNLRLLFSAIFLALIFVVGVTAPYIYAFSMALSTQQEKWAQFGDYFGGLLNPIFSILAFLGLIWSITVQQRESREAARHLLEQTELARKEFQYSRADRLDEDLMYVIKDIDARLTSLRNVVVGTSPAVTVEHMVKEASNVRSGSGSISGSFNSFVTQAQTPGSVIEATFREISYLVDKMQEFLGQYAIHKQGAYSPKTVYFADKVYQLLDLLEAVDGNTDRRTFFATVSDRNH